MLMYLTAATVMHEETHAQICQQSGGKSSISYNFLGGTTTCTGPDNSQMQMLAEIVGYNMTVLGLAILIAGFMISITVISRQ